MTVRVISKNEGTAKMKVVEVIYITQKENIIKLWIDEKTALRVNVNLFKMIIE